MTLLIYVAPTLTVFVVMFVVAAIVLFSSGVRGLEHLQRVLFWGAGLGAAAFIVGFVGPALFSESPQGPLFGIFISGPIGAVVGCIIGGERSIRIIRGRGAPKA